MDEDNPSQIGLRTIGYYVLFMIDTYNYFRRSSDTSYPLSLSLCLRSPLLLAFPLSLFLSPSFSCCLLAKSLIMFYNARRTDEHDRPISHLGEMQLIRVNRHLLRRLSVPAPLRRHISTQDPSVFNVGRCHQGAGFHVLNIVLLGSSLRNWIHKFCGFPEGKGNNGIA